MYNLDFFFSLKKSKNQIEKEHNYSIKLAESGSRHKSIIRKQSNSCIDRFIRGSSNIQILK